jgi:hypothetical protein
MCSAAAEGGSSLATHAGTLYGAMARMILDHEGPSSVAVREQLESRDYNKGIEAASPVARPLLRVGQRLGEVADR